MNYNCEGQTEGQNWHLQKSIKESLGFRNRNDESGTSWTREVERRGKALIWTRISNPLTVQLAKILLEKRRGTDLI